MNYFFLDASALVKQYHKEEGTDVFSSLFETLLETDPKRLVISSIALAETIAAWYRQGHQDGTPQAVLTTVADQILEDGLSVSRCHISNSIIVTSIDLIVRHSINASDALLLQQALMFSRNLSQVDRTLVLVSSDKRFLRAATSEGLRTLNPEVILAQDVAAMMAES